MKRMLDQWPWTARGVARASCLVLAVWVSPLAAQTPASDLPDPAANPVWQKIMASQFAGKTLQPASEDTLRLDVPARADDPSTVPVGIRSPIPMSAARHIEKVVLIVDNNPSPIAAVFRFHPASGRVDLETRIRVESYTHVRAVALMSDGSAVMAIKHVKASGGCTAPAGRDAERARANLGKMRLALPQPLRQSGPALAQLMVSHPNESGLAMDQATRLYPQAHYVRQVEVQYRGQPVWSAELDFSISDNPHFRFYFVAEEGGLLEASVTDTQDKVFKGRLDLAR